MTMPPAGKGEPTVRELITSAAADVAALLSAQVELAKAELRQSAKQAGSAFGLLIGAGVLAVLGLIFLLVTIAYVLVALGLPVWAGFGIVTLALVIIAAILALLGKKHAEKVRAPERTLAQLEKTAQALSDGATSAGVSTAQPSPGQPGPAETSLTPHSAGTN